MIQIGKTIISFDIFEGEFLCDLQHCKGACCIEGDSGAPLTQEEAIEIETYYPVFEKYISPEYRTVVETVGTSVTDNDGELVTPLINNKECAYTFIDDEGITKCAIEKAY
ncbi:MAG TPA: DUF3109 family protein, partial [Prolixibacteraceae bacterium]|nr:DUF3109 family protein [Prolixibacteraceae bacterium]